MQPKNPEEHREKNQKYSQPQRQERQGNNNNGGGQRRPQISPMKTNRGESIRAGRGDFFFGGKAVGPGVVY